MLESYITLNYYTNNLLLNCFVSVATNCMIKIETLFTLNEI